MHKLKKAAAVAVMVGGIGLIGSGVASANGDPNIDNLQLVDCEQSFDGGALFAPVAVATTGDSETNIGNFCTVIGHIDG
ncbi:hypothetical protein M2271_001297 [Streptomyces sp. LBL]|uniref:hypothetical protein n=1 Tax=Streptomyces sp. LBL TaxID=2940562 RepID=UPI0024731862|nr:hypothetical protein [Streptomyces sp. LBL]MDH6623510.1 hypothetical protein [Streptomyces sp. LBL]